MPLHDTIARLRRLHPRDPDIMKLCRELEARLGDKPRGTPERPPHSIYHSNPKRYYREYMRWYRWNGQAGNGRDESPL